MPGNYNTQTGDRSDTLTENKVEEPKHFRVLLYNDNYTTMEFVVGILCKIFNKSIDEATNIMLNVHHKGVGQCGIYTREIAETKVKIVRKYARQAGFPLKCTMEEE